MREDGVYQLEVHVAGICIRNNKVLIAKRSETRRLLPEKWECGGGQVKYGEDFDEAVRRQLREELGIVVGRIVPISTYNILIDSEQKKIPGLEFACDFESYVEGNAPKISDEHSEYRWQDIQNLEGLDFIEDLDDKIKRAYDVLRIED